MPRLRGRGSRRAAPCPARRHAADRARRPRAAPVPVRDQPARGGRRRHWRWRSVARPRRRWRSRRPASRARQRRAAAEATAAKAVTVDRSHRRAGRLDGRRPPCSPRFPTAFTARGCCPIAAPSGSSGGRRMRAEDVDTVTRRRVPSPIVPAAYAEGCPDLSPDGKRLVYQGHAPDGRPFAFLSPHPDGRDGVPVVQTAEPSMASEPTWLADGQTFSYDIDAKHMGVFSTAGGRMNVLPDVTPQIVRDDVPLRGRQQRLHRDAVRQRRDGDRGHLRAGAHRRRSGFAFPKLVLDLRLEGEQLYFAHRNKGRGATSSRRSTSGGAHRADRRPDPGSAVALSDDDARRVWPSSTFGWRRTVGAKAERGSREADERAATSGTPAAAGTIWSSAAELEPERTGHRAMDGAGRRIERLTSGPADWSPACSPRRQRLVLPAARAAHEHPALRSASGCREIFPGFAIGLSASADGRRLAFLTMDPRGSMVRWMSGRRRRAARDRGDARPTARPAGRPDSTDLGVAPARPQDRLDRGRRRFRPRDRARRCRAATTATTARRSRVAGQPGPAHRLRSDVADAAARTGVLGLE